MVTVIKKGRHYGLEDEGQIVLKPKFTKSFVDSISECSSQELLQIKLMDIAKNLRSNGTYCFVKNGKVGLRNYKDEIVVEPKYSQILDIKNDCAFILTNSNQGFLTENKFGLLGPKNEVLLEPMFDWISYFDYGVARVRVGSKYGLINLKGEIVVEPRFQEINKVMRYGVMVIKEHRDKKEHNGITSYQGYYGLMDITGKMLTNIEYHSASPLQAIAVVRVGKIEEKGTRRSVKWGLINFKGEVLTEIKYKRISYSDWMNEKKQVPNGVRALKADNEVLFVDKSGQLVT